MCRQHVKPNADDVGKSLEAAIKTEMAVYESSGVRGRSLQLVYNYLMSITPASVEAERAFSAAGTLCMRIRSRLEDDALDELCFLRSFYRRRQDGGLSEVCVL